MTAALEQVAALVRRESGIVIRPAQHGALSAAIRRAAPAADAAGFLRLLVDPVAGPRALGRLLDEVAIKETSFLRDRRQLEAIPWELLRESAQAAGSSTIRVWSAGCATGEEAYSLALLASQAFAPAAPPVHILATDLSAHALAVAGEGRYRPRSTRDLDPALRGRYFEEEGDVLVVGPRLRTLVELRRHNLARDPVPPLGEPPFDLVVCRNVLIYFDAAAVKRAVAGLERAVRRDGMLLLGAADTLCGAAGRPADRAARERRARLSGRPRPPLGHEPGRRFEDRLAAVVAAADENRLADALALARALVAERPLDARAHYLRGLVELERGAADAAVDSLRRALYVEPDFALAAFNLGRAHDELGEAPSARRAYERALRALQSGAGGDAELLAQVDPADIAAACRSRLAAL